MISLPPKMAALARYRRGRRLPPDALVLGRIIEQVARDPRVPVNRLETLLRAARRQIADGARASFASDMVQLQQDIIRLGYTASDLHVGPYAEGWHRFTYRAMPLLASHGFSATFHLSRDSKQTTITAILSHHDGQSLLTSMRTSPGNEEPTALRATIGQVLASLVAPHLASWDWDGDWSN